jgi:hypothetical protein
MIEIVERNIDFRQFWEDMMQKLQAVRRMATVLLVGTIFSGLPEKMGAQGGDRHKTIEQRDNGFVFCRLRYSKVRSEPDGNGWSTDYPQADRNLMIRFSELTPAPVDFVQRTQKPVLKSGRDYLFPNHWIVDISDSRSGLSTCPFVMASDVGTLQFDTAEVERLRTYLLKGGFLWVDDFWGPAAWNFWEAEIARVLEPETYPIFDISMDHPLLRTLYLTEVPQIAHIGFWRGSHGETSERGKDSIEVNVRGIEDSSGRLMVLMTHNTDIGDSWERESDEGFFRAFAPSGYSIAVNVLLYVMAH